jgi:hypothetical protein
VTAGKAVIITGAFLLRRSGWSHEAHREMRPRRMAVPSQQGRTEPGLQAVWPLLPWPHPGSLIPGESNPAWSGVRPGEILLWGFRHYPTEFSTGTKREYFRDIELP